ncbi:MAG: glycosyltransferase family 39 protein [Candidatus Acidiferrum sp.]
MSESPTTSPEKSQTSAAARIGRGILIVATLYVCYFSHLGAIGFVGPDEPRYAWIARAMAETGDWVTPRLYGKAWFEKPPLYYWEAAISFKVFGVSEAAARLPSAISALLATLALAWLAWRMYGGETARWLLLLLPTTVGMIGFSHAAATDMPFSGMLTIAMVCAAVVLRLAPAAGGGAGPAPTSFSTPWAALVLFGFFLGLAVLAKGPAGIILCGGAVFFWAIFTKRWRDAFRLLHPGAIATFCLTALPWYILCARRNPDFFRIFIIEHNFKRFLTPEFQHIQPFWFYIPVILVAFLPWTGTLLWSLTVGIPRAVRRRQISDRASYFVYWGLFCLIFFSLSHSKLPGYILPAVPAICLSMARSSTGKASAEQSGFQIAHLAAALVFLCLAGTAGILGWTSIQPVHVAAKAACAVIGLIALANLAIGVLAQARDMSSTGNLAAGFCILPILLALLLSSRLLPAFFFGDPSGRTLAHELRARGVPNDRIYVAHMRRGKEFSLSFYLHHETPSWDRNDPLEGYLLTSSRNCTRLVPQTWQCEELPFDPQSTGEFLYRVSSRSQ